jgi:1-acyl-sn-glycerol-3-phosphate acyltransferase
MRSTARDRTHIETEVPKCIARRSPRMFGWFAWYARRHVARHFHAVRLARAGPAPFVPQGPLIIVLNHPSWWDPLIALILSGLWPDRAPYAPIDAGALARYRFSERLGLFGIEPRTSRGAREFLRVGLAVAHAPGTSLWLTAQGRFADPRERPVRLMGGVGHLVARLGRGCVVPLALEYPFWSESKPEALARFGPAIHVDGADAPDAWTARIAEALETTQDALAVETLPRDPARFEVLIEGRAGVGGVYDLWGRLRAAVRNERFQVEHSDGSSAPHETSDQ